MGNKFLRLAVIYFLLGVILGIIMAASHDFTYRAVHALRHYSGTKLYRAGSDLEAVARHLGHSTLETTRIYAKWSDESLRSSVGKW